MKFTQEAREKWRDLCYVQEGTCEYCHGTDILNESGIPSHLSLSTPPPLLPSLHTPSSLPLLCPLLIHFVEGYYRETNQWDYYFGQSLISPDRLEAKFISQEEFKNDNDNRMIFPAHVVLEVMQQYVRRGEEKRREEKGREGKGREGKGREGKGREGKGREEKRREETKLIYEETYFILVYRRCVAA